MKRTLNRFARELVVIVLGVLIALWANASFQARTDRETEGENVLALRDGFRASLKNLDRAVAARAETFAALLLEPLDRRPKELGAQEVGPGRLPWPNRASPSKLSSCAAQRAPKDIRQGRARWDTREWRLA